jgi:hypothetical protein
MFVLYEVLPLAMVLLPRDVTGDTGLHPRDCGHADLVAGES